jgi:hypothetical protein
MCDDANGGKDFIPISCNGYKLRNEVVIITIYQYADRFTKQEQHDTTSGIPLVLGFPEDDKSANRKKYLQPDHSWSTFTENSVITRIIPPDRNDGN